MSLYVTILGCSAAIPTRHRNCSAQVVNVDGFKMLIDAGESVQNQIRKSSIKMQSVGTILISHLHGDHFFGLPGLISTMHLCGRTEPVDIFAPEGLQEIMEKIFALGKTVPNFEIRYHTINCDSPVQILENNKCKVTAFPIYHSVECYGFLVEEKMKALRSIQKDATRLYNLTPDEIFDIKRGADLVRDGKLIAENSLITMPRKAHRYAYCCDTSYDDDLIPAVHGADLLCFDTTFDAKSEDVAMEKGHGTSVHAAKLALEANVGQLLLSHFSARFSKVDALLAEAQAIFPNTIVAEDLKVIEIR